MARKKIHDPCAKCAGHTAVRACDKFDGSHRFCHVCGLTKLMHQMATLKKSKTEPKLTVIEGGKDDDADRWSAWLNGEQS